MMTAQLVSIGYATAEQKLTKHEADITRIYIKNNKLSILNIENLIF